MLDKIAGRIHYPGNKYFILANSVFVVCPHFPLMSVTGIAGFKKDSAGFGFHDQLEDFGEINVAGVRAFVVAPADVHPQLFGGNITQSIIQCINLHLSVTQKGSVIFIAVFDVPPHR